MNANRTTTGRRTCPRPGFTLIELVVVMGIIGVLAALTASGIFSFLDAQTQSNTETNIRAIDKVLRQQMDAVLSAADKEPLPNSVVLLASNNGTVPDPQQKRARVIWRTLRLVQEFPMSYAEAASPTGSSGIATSPIYGSLVSDLPGKKSYINALASAKPFAPPYPPFGMLPYPGAAGESSTCLLLALQQSRGAGKLNPEDLHSGAADTNNDGLKELVDGWGNPLGFWRFPTGNTELTGTLDLSPTTPTKINNPLDPEGTLVNPLWNNALSVSNPASGLYWFERICHKTFYFKPQSLNAPPVVGSAGKDGRFGLNVDSLKNDFFGPFPLADMTPNLGIYPNDNIYNYRLRIGSRGD